MKRSLRVAVLSALAMATTFSTAFAGDLTIMSTSDVHGSVIGWNYFTAQPADVGLAKVSTVVKDERAKLTKDDAMLVVDAGDILQGTPLDTYMAKHPNDWKVHPMLAAFNKIGYDAIEVGNHEFTYGLDYLKKSLGSFPGLLGANVIDDKTGTTWAPLKRHIIKTVKIDGQPLKVGIIGTDTPAIPNLEAESHYAGVHFDQQVPVVKQCIKELQDEGADIIILLAHSGIAKTADNENEDQVVQIAEACPELSLIVCAHTHVPVDNATGAKSKGKTYDHAVINGVPIIQSGKDGKFVGKSDLTIHKVDGKWQVENIKTQAISTKGVKDDPAIVKIAKPWHEKTLKELQQVIGTASDEFSGYESNHQDSAIVDLINDVQRHYAGTQLSASASFNTSQNIDKGPITLQEISGLYIYENYLYGIKVNGKQLRQYMEKAASYYGTTPDFNYDMLSGVDYTIDLTKPVGSRITKLQYQGKDVQDSDTFTLAINDYRFHGGSGYMAAMGFTKDNPPEVVFDSLKQYGDDGQMRNLLVQYIKDHGTITPHVDNNWNVVK